MTINPTLKAGDFGPNPAAAVNAPTAVLCNMDDRSRRVTDQRCLAMRAMLSYRFLVPLLLGAAVGLFWADAVWWHKDSGVRQWVESVPVLDNTIEVFHLPAKLLFYGTAIAHIGRSGEAGWVMLVYCYIAQWTIIGSLVGFWKARRHERKNRIA